MPKFLLGGVTLHSFLTILFLLCINNTRVTWQNLPSVQELFQGIQKCRAYITSRYGTRCDTVVYFNWQKTSEYSSEMPAASMTVTEKTSVESGCKWSGNFFSLATNDELPLSTSSSARPKKHLRKLLKTATHTLLMFSLLFSYFFIVFCWVWNQWDWVNKKADVL